jgi:hypothetical protein
MDKFRGTRRACKFALILACMLSPVFANPDSPVRSMESALSCILTTPRGRSAVQGIGLSLGDKADVRYYVGSIHGMEPTPGSYYLMIYSHDKLRAWILIAEPVAKGGFVPGTEAFQMRRDKSIWKVEEGFGGLATYRAIGRFATWLSRNRQEHHVVLEACQKSCSSQR